MFKYAPEVIRQRSKIQPGVKWWDNVIMVVYGLATFLIPAAAGLDAGRGVPSFGIEVAAIGAVLFVGSSLFITWAIVVNRFFVNTVVVQKKQKVVSTGPYAIVRHPGYLGMLFMYGTMPLIIGSAYALVPFGILALALITRTYLEDKTLQKELPGYLAYTRKVKFRLVPSMW
jgi:protein-S-isoprenylcysteine O-methyltransferase Ste14